MIQRILNGFSVTTYGRFFWLNAYGFGMGRIGGKELQVYRFGWKLRVDYFGNLH